MNRCLSSDRKRRGDLRTEELKATIDKLRLEIRQEQGYDAQQGRKACCFYPDLSN
jgi:hypothetical protein